MKEEKPDEIRGIYHCQETKMAVSREAWVQKAEPRRGGFYIDHKRQTVTNSEKEFIRTVEVTEAGSPHYGKILPVASRYGKIKDGDEVLFFISDGEPPRAAMVHPKNHQPCNSGRSGPARNPLFSAWG